MKPSTIKTLNLPFAEVEASGLKAAIIDKFGSLSQFGRLTKRDRKEMAIRLRNSSETAQQYQAAMLHDAKNICAQPKAPGYHLTTVDRDKLRNALSKYPTVTEFCQECKPAKGKPFTSVFVSRVTCGSTQKITPKVRELAASLNVELNASSIHE